MARKREGGVQRASIVERLRETPGLRPSDLARVFDVHPSTAEYHLRRLAREDRITRERVGRELYHYVIGDGLCRRGRKVHARLTEAGRGLLRLAVDRRVVARQAVVERGFSSSAVRWAIDRFIELGALERLAWGVYEMVDDWTPCTVAALREAPCTGCNEADAAGEAYEVRRATSSPSPSGRIEVSRSR